MFVRFHERKENEDGFTLIELLVVILIIAILAAIAIPVFLNQRKKGWAAAVQSSLRNAAESEESYATSNNGLYTKTLAGLTGEGYTPTADVTLVLKTNTTDTAFCIEATHARGEAGWNWKTGIWDSAAGRPDVADTCPGIYT